MHVAHAMRLIWLYPYETTYVLTKELPNVKE